MPFAFCPVFVLANYRTEELVHTGTIEGFVRFPGETPPPAMFGNRDDPNCPHGIAQNHLLVKQLTLGLQNAVVILESDHGLPEKLSRAELTTVGCMLTPRVQWAPSGSSVFLKNGDGAQHQLHAFQRDVTEFEVPLLARGATARRPLVHVGFYKINCDKHPWERAWFYVSEHPYVAITDAAGHFAIAGVPPGHYRIGVWHEGWVERRKDKADRIDYRPMAQSKSIDLASHHVAHITFDELRELPR